MLERALFILAVCGVYLGMNWYVLGRLCNLFALKRAVWFYVALLPLTLSFVASLSLESAIGNRVTGLFFSAAMVWLGLCFLLLWILFLQQILSLVLPIPRKVWAAGVCGFAAILAIYASVTARTITVRREQIRGLPFKIAQLGIGLVPQGRYIFPSLTVKENLMISARGQTGPDSWSLDKVFSLFPVLEKRSWCSGTLLSGGEQQMLAIGRALMSNPRLILMDEPSEGLSPRIVKEVGRIVSDLKQRGFSILLVEQNLPMAMKAADYLYILSNGQVVHESTPESLRQSGEIKAKYIGVG